MSRALVLLLAVMAAGCYSASRARPDRTTIATDAKQTLTAALVVPTAAPAASRDQDFGLHYDKAMALFQAGSYPEAIAEFEAAYGIKADPLLLYNIASAYRKAGRFKDALDHYERFVHDAPNDEQLKKAQDYISELQKKLELDDPKPKPRSKHHH